MPVRKRTALVDQRISRSHLSIEANPQELLEAQHALTNPRRAISPIPETKAVGQPSSEPSVSALGLGDPTKTEVNEPQSFSTQETPTTILLSKPASQQEPSIASPIDGDAPPSFAEPDDSDNEHENDNSFENDASATMQYLSSVDDAPEDQPIAGAIPTSATAGLKRAGSGETSRLRGPRGRYLIFGMSEMTLTIRQEFEVPGLVELVCPRRAVLHETRVRLPVRCAWRKADDSSAKIVGLISGKIVYSFTYTCDMCRI